MKKGLKVVGVFLVILLVTGCMDFNTTMNIKNDKSVDLTLSMKMDMLEFANSFMAEDGMWNMMKEYLIEQTCKSACPMDTTSLEYETCITTCKSEANSGAENMEKPSESEIKAYLDEYLNSDEFNIDNMFSEEDKENLESKGYKVDVNMDKENYVYSVNISKNFANIDNISKDQEVIVNIEDLFNGDAEEIFFTKNNNTYKANFKWSKEDNDNLSIEGLDTDKFLTYTYEVNLPNQAISNNADKVSNDKKTLTWNITSDNNKNINYEFAFQTPKATEENSANKENILAYGLIAVGSITLVIAIIVFVINKKKTI